ncbi:glycosyltransferase family 4 protein [Serinibacter arcticus]|uniref:glycosyltransferase family 4 protein n=1 Tax=Serinibacter arcticus TaxID=1655435 RepID=UPI0013050D4A|nr:glycosyltransferase family 1 protein [Serinibacter arcticus]
MRVLVVTESWKPSTNGVVRSVEQVVTHLVAAGVEVALVAPGASREHGSPGAVDGVARVLSTPSLHVSRLGCSTSVPAAGLRAFVRDLAPDVVHVASPFLLGAQAVQVAAEEGVPSVAVYQTDVASFAVANGLAFAERPVWRWIARIHRRATLNLACTHDALTALAAQGVPRLRRWHRGVDLGLFTPAVRDADVRTALAGGRDVPVVGYMGRLAPEKELPLLRVLAGREDLALALIGDGPSRAELAASLPGATFTGRLDRDELARAVASLDVFVHPGRHETLCQAAMQAMACGVPAVVPDAGGVAELVDGTSGARFVPGSAASLDDAVAAVLSDRTARGARAREVSLERGLAASVAELRGHYEEAVRLARASRTTTATSSTTTTTSREAA